MPLIPDKESTLSPSRNLAASAGRWSAQHRKTAILGWILFVVLATVVGGTVGLNEIDESASGSGESKRGDMIVEAAGFPEKAGEQVLIQGKGSIKAGDPRGHRRRQGRRRPAEAIQGITEIESPLNAPDRVNTVSKDGRSVVVNFKMPGTDEHAEQLVDQPLAAVAAAQKAHPASASSSSATPRPPRRSPPRTPRTARSRELISYGLMLIILLVAFGALVAAGLPLVLGATAVAATVGLLGPVSQVYALAPTSPSSW